MRTLLAGLVVFSLGGLPAAAAQTDCTALKAEVEQLRAKVRQLESTLEAAAQKPVSAQVATLPGAATKPAATVKVVVEEPYASTGCSRGLFQGIAPGKWQEAGLWQDLQQGQTPAQVEAILGPEHYDERGGGNVIWHYGRCGVASRAQVLFENGQLSDWRAPSY